MMHKFVLIQATLFSQFFRDTYIVMIGKLYYSNNIIIVQNILSKLHCTSLTPHQAAERICLDLAIALIMNKKVFFSL